VNTDLGSRLGWLALLTKRLPSELLPSSSLRNPIAEFLFNEAVIWRIFQPEKREKSDEKETDKEKLERMRKWWLKKTSQ